MSKKAKITHGLPKIELLRDLLRHNGLDAMIIGSEDSHLSEYVAPRDERRAWISGFTGSAGTAVITMTAAYLWTDGRYWTQASAQLAAAEWRLMKVAEPGVPTVEEWLGGGGGGGGNGGGGGTGEGAEGGAAAAAGGGLASGSKIAVDPMLVSFQNCSNYEEACEKSSMQLVFLEKNLVDQIWEDQPEFSSHPIQAHPLEYAGKPSSEKLVEVREEMVKAGADAYIVAALDEVAWLLNLRGGDVPHNPVFRAYAVVRADAGGGATLCVDGGRLEPAARQQLETSNVTIRPYTSILEVIKEISDEGLKIGFDPHWCPAALARAVPAGLRATMDSPLALPKALKNPAELEGLRRSHVRDGAALTCFLAWLERCLETSDGGGRGWPLTETSAAAELEAFRARVRGHRGPSFPTICGFGPHGAVIHYQAEEATAAPLAAGGVLLLDSGAQYVDGTTDVTRTLWLPGPGAERPEEKVVRAYTRVLQGHIALARAIFPEGTLGSKLDPLARLALWADGLDYKHGTGHGVGAFLNVHEGPQGISYRHRPNEKGFQIGMTTSNEPGYYQENEFGIRIENICICAEANVPNNFGGVRYCRLETITLCPIQRQLIDSSLLSADEVKWINEYHAEVLEKLSPLVKQIENEVDCGNYFHDYLVRETLPL